MKFRHLMGARLALTTGHVVVVNENWVELDEHFHSAAFAAGCQCDQGFIANHAQEEQENSDDAVKTLDEPVLIREAILQMLKREQEGDFTAAGNPNLNVVASLCGFRVDKESVLEAWHAIEKEIAAAEQAGD